LAEPLLGSIIQAPLKLGHMLLPWQQVCCLWEAQRICIAFLSLKAATEDPRT